MNSKDEVDISEARIELLASDLDNHGDVMSTTPQQRAFYDLAAALRAQATRIRELEGERNDHCSLIKVLAEEVGDLKAQLHSLTKGSK